jgi:protein ImuB
MASASIEQNKNIIPRQSSANRTRTHVNPLKKWIFWFGHVDGCCAIEERVMGTRVLSLWLPYAAIDRLRQGQSRSVSSQRQAPEAICQEDGRDRRLVALCPRAERAGLAHGMSVDEAIRQVPGLRLHAADPAGDLAYLDHVRSLCERYTPFAAIDRSFPADKGASLWLDISNSAHLAGGESCLLAKLLGRLKRAGVNAKAAIADHPGTAWAACRFGGEERSILPANAARVVLAPMPLKALRLGHEDCEAIESAGLDRIEHLYALPRRSLSARFGDHVATRLDQALGLVDEPIAADMPRPVQQAQMIFADPVTNAAMLPSLIERLIRQLTVGLEAAGLGAKCLTLALFRVDNSAVTCSIGPARPSSNVAELKALIGDRFDGIDLGFGLERMILDAIDIEPILPETIRWQGLGTAADDPPGDVAKIGYQRALTCAGNDNVGPDQDGGHQAARPAPPVLRPAPQEAPVLPRTGVAYGALALATEPIEAPRLQETPPRPLRLLRQPEPIEAIASLPGEPPVLFRWRRRLHKVVSARGPETVAPDWWRIPDVDRLCSSAAKDGRCSASNPEPRHYFAVEDSEGSRFWLFRDGIADNAADALPRWFLHGIFG